MVEPNFHIETDLNASALAPYFSFLKLLNPNLTEEQFNSSVEQLAQNKYYKVMLVYLNNNCVALSGYWISTKFYCGKYLELDNVIVLPEYQKMGVGKLILDTCNEIALQQNCNVLMLDAYIENTAAQKFYEREGFVKKGFHFLKKTK